MAGERKIEALGSFILRPDVELLPVRSLPDDLRNRLNDDDAYAVTRRYSRIPSNVIDSETAALLEQFQKPRTITEAILRYSIPRGIDPKAILEEAFPVLAQLIASQDLVPPAADLATAVSATLAPGDIIEGFSVVRCIQLLDDSEVYEVRRSKEIGALKLSRSADAVTFGALHREAQILNLMDGTVSPRCLAFGDHCSKSFLIVEWCKGIDSETAARSLRNRALGGDRPRMLKMVQSIVAAFGKLHEQGVFHGDIHPSNVLVDESPVQPIKIIDFGLAIMPQRAELCEAPRGGVGPFLDPEYAMKAQRAQKAPPVTSESEQYSLAALIYFLVAGLNYCDFSLDRLEMYEQIQNALPLPFSKRGVAPWPSLEAALRRALQKDPKLRFPSLASFANEIHQVSIDQESTRRFLRTDLRHQRRTIVGKLLADLGPGSTACRSGLIEGPTMSLNYGAAGIAYALYRMAMVEASPSLLALSDDWSMYALSNIDQPSAFTNIDLGITSEAVGVISPFHTRSGVFAVRALVDHALGIETSQQAAVRAFVDAGDAPFTSFDLTIGRSGTLLAAALILEATRDRVVEAFGTVVHAEIQAEIERLPVIGTESTRMPYLGIAHGWAGLLYGSLRWCEASGTVVPSRVSDRLNELSSLAKHRGECTSWPVSLTKDFQSLSMPGWCHGSAGYVFLWTLASELLDRSDLLDLAIGAGHATLSASTGDRSLCCGLPGRAYSMLTIYRVTGDSIWLDAAWALAGRAIRTAGFDNEQHLSLFKGDLGLGVLVSDLAAPERAVMPFFEPEGWPTKSL